MDDLLNFFNILSDKTRLRILLLLLENELCVCELMGALAMSQPRISQQLSILKQSRVVKDRRDGKWIYYKVDESISVGFMKKVFELLPIWLQNDDTFRLDKLRLKACFEEESKTGKCDITTFTNIIKENIK